MFSLRKKEKLSLNYPQYRLLSGAVFTSVKIVENLRERRETIVLFSALWRYKYCQHFYSFLCFDLFFCRFILALQKLQEGYTIIEKDNKSLRINQNREFWPGTRTVIEESDPICLKVGL